MRPVSNALIQAINSQETGEAIIILITIDHASIDPPVRVSSDAVNTTSRGNTYYAYPFEVTLPDDTESSFAKATLTIDNVHRDLVTAIRSITTPPDVTIEIVLGSAPNTVEAAFTGFKLTDVNYDALTITGSLTLDHSMNEPYPAYDFVPSLFPGVF